MNRALRALCVLCLICASAQQVQAQALSPRSVALAALLPVLPAQPDPVSRAHQNRARRILAAGVGLALSAAITPFYVMPHRKPCFGSERRPGGPPLTAALVLGVVGVAAAAGGGTWLGLEARKHGYYASKRERLIAMSIGAVALALGQALQAPLYLFDQICHS